MIDKFQKKRTIKIQPRGALLLELLIAISLLAIILSFGANAVFLSLQSNKASGEQDVASSLASEGVEAVRAVSEEDWQNIYSLTKSTEHYKTTQSNTKWILATGNETITLNGVIYTRYVVIDNISRDGSGNIETAYSSTDDDPSTQQVTVSVSWPGGNDAVEITGFLFRYKNKVCAQSGWATADPGNTVHVCADASYDAKDAGIDATGGLHLQ